LSVLQPTARLVPRPGPLGAPRQRFDYVVRTRRLTRQELQRLNDHPPDPAADYPQRGAVLFALRELTGRNVGPTTTAWLQLYPDAEVEAEAARLGTIILNAKPARQEELIVQERNAKGPAHTLALAFAIPSLQGSVQIRARDALAQRFTRLTPDSLRDRLRDDDPEVRRAAVSACLLAGGEAADELVPGLVALLDDEPMTIRAAMAALKGLTGEDFDDPADWKAWWKNRLETSAGGEPPADGK
jgi:hypothetical protein